MRNKILSLVLVLFTGTINLSCDNGNDLKPAGSISPIVEAELPIVGNIGQEIDFTVSHVVYNGCGYFSSQETTKIGSTLIVTFYAQYREGFCTMDIPILKTNYKFIPTQTGMYTFKFNKGETGYLIKTILIN